MEELPKRSAVMPNYSLAILGGNYAPLTIERVTLYDDIMGVHSMPQPAGGLSDTALRGDAELAHLTQTRLLGPKSLLKPLRERCALSADCKSVQHSFPAGS